MYGRKEVESYEMTHHKKAEELRCYGVTQGTQGPYGVTQGPNDLGFPTSRDFAWASSDFAMPT